MAEEIPQSMEAGEPASVQDMEVETGPASDTDTGAAADAGGQPDGGDKRGREGEEDDAPAGDVDSKKQKLEKSAEEVRLEKLEETEEEEKKEVNGEGEDDGKGTAKVSLGPKEFASSVDMFDYLYKFLHFWAPNLNINEYEHMVLLDLLKKGHAEADKKIGEGVLSFQIRYHPTWKSRCFFLVRENGTSDDFSFRKCIDNLLPLPENLKKHSGPDEGKNAGGHGGGGGRRGRGGGFRGGRGRGRRGWK